MISAADVLRAPTAHIIDLRTPSEFAEDHLPGAHNLPLLSDAERAVVGLLYSQDSPERAFAHGLDRVLDTIEELMVGIGRVAELEIDGARVREKVLELADGGIVGIQNRLDPTAFTPDPGGAAPIILHCWRGGLRSMSVVALLGRLGVESVAGLEGGYRAYRQMVMEQLEEWQAPQAVVLRGLTGVGKTLVLRELEKLRPGSTIDLEGAAGHRSSLLGMVGLEPVSQKAFDTRLAHRLREPSLTSDALVLEGESRKVGNVIIPPRIWEAMGSATNILLTAERERRIDVLLEDYLAREQDRPQLREQLAEVERRIQPEAPLVEWFDGGEERKLVGVLLDTYYDPLYQHSEKGKTYRQTLKADDPKAAAKKIDQWLTEGSLGAQP
jgi:tRNA 2-selenouridine synthase